MNIRKAPTKLALILWVSFTVTATFAADAIDEARRLLETRKAEQAYQLLAPLEAERAGDPDYDFLLGLSALESGRPGLAVFALERVLAVRPDHIRARAELARAYFEIRDDAAAKQEFENVKKMGPPDPVAQAIEKYLQAIDVRFESLKATQWRAYAQLGVGADTNVASATDSSLVAIPALGNIVLLLDPAGQERGDTFVSGEAGFTVGHRISDNTLGFASVRLNERINESEHDVDTGVIDFTAGLSRSVGKHRYTGALVLQRFEVGNDLFRTITGGTLDWRYTLDGRNQITVFGQTARLNFHPDAQSARDVQQLRAGAAWAHAFEGVNAPTMFLSGYIGDEEERSGLPYLGRRFFGFRVGGEYFVNQKAQVFYSLNAEFSDYGGTEPLFLEARDDEYYLGVLGFRYRMAGGWTISPQVNYSRNKSTIPINDYSRTVLLTTLRYDFR